MTRRHNKHPREQHGMEACITVSRKLAESKGSHDVEVRKISNRLL